MPDTPPDTDPSFPTQPDTEGERKMSFPPSPDPNNLGPRRCIDWQDYVRVTIGTLLWLALCFGPVLLLWRVS
jgi:hypothetical protein